MNNISSSFKKIDLQNGNIINNVDYGVGYTIVWENKPLQLLTQRCGCVPQDILMVVINQLDFLNKTSLSNPKYEQARKLLVQTIKVLNGVSDENK